MWTCQLSTTSASVASPFRIRRSPRYRTFGRPPPNSRTKRRRTTTTKTTTPIAIVRAILVATAIMTSATQELSVQRRRSTEAEGRDVTTQVFAVIYSEILS